VGDPAVVEDTLAVKLTVWPTADGFAEETTVVVVAANEGAKEVAVIGIASGLPGPLFSTSTVPFTVNSG
jgi:hypothetical protein